MPSTVSKTKKRPTATKRRSSRQKPEEIIAAPINKPEPAYINIHENSGEQASKMRLLWITVAIFSVILAIFWLFILKTNIARETTNIGLDQVGKQITNSLARFDTEIKDRAIPKDISSEDLAAIKNDLEIQIKNNPDSSTWPTHELTNTKLSIQFPSNWSLATGTKSLIISDQLATTSNSTDNKIGKITINPRSNSKKLSLADWQKVNNISVEGLAPERPIFTIGTSSPESLIYQSSAVTVNEIKYHAYINSLTNKTVYEIIVEAKGDNSYYRPLTEEIIRTIKILK